MNSQDSGIVLIDKSGKILEEENYSFVDDVLICRKENITIHAKNVDYITIQCSHSCRVIAGSDCKIVTGGSCYIDCESECDITCGPYCSIVAGRECNVKCDSNCFLRLGENCVLECNEYCNIITGKNTKISQKGTNYILRKVGLQTGLTTHYGELINCPKKNLNPYFELQQITKR